MITTFHLFTCPASLRIREKVLLRLEWMSTKLSILFGKRNKETINGLWLHKSDFEVLNPSIFAVLPQQTPFNPEARIPESPHLPCQRRERRRNSDLARETRRMCRPLPA